MGLTDHRSGVQWLTVAGLLALGVAGSCDGDGDDDATDDSGVVEADADADADADTDTDTDADSDPASFTGVQRYEYANYPRDPNYRECDVRWDITGAASSSLCPDCTWAFDVELVVDTANSVDTIGCIGTVGSPTATWGFKPASDGVTGELMVEAEGSWTANYTVTSWVEATGAMQWWGGTAQYYYDYYGVPYYRMDYWSGNATVTLP